MGAAAAATCWQLRALAGYFRASYNCFRLWLITAQIPEPADNSNQNPSPVIARQLELLTTNLNKTKWIAGLRFVCTNPAARLPFAMLFAFLVVIRVIIPPPLG
ncbi:hypothetical protein [Hymenobacter cellulosilyticus]|uniref:Uncharacterized protein n=1 Tax=Hymenobacter cellulosilyticus TaxID=2932248 RepID=A0A8T9Q3F7_9BACT|nr:hypothetical protein [Hymenobacter cellulosilyticus]UOQ72266.1 hypothetical protein MUN79_27575 [Hymenobacter cellulosilyticus]